LATGAAADRLEPPLERAYFELLERLVLTDNVVEMRSGARRDRPGAAQRRLSVSNGVALHGDLVRATRAAALEAIERDRVLRSWYGGERPERVDVPLGISSSSLRSDYELRVVRFRKGVELAGQETIVVGIVAFPRVAHAPLSVGFAARSELDDAVAAAERELLQQVAFGWGEGVPSESPEAEPTPEFNLDFFAYPGNHVVLRRWLDGEHEGRGPDLPSEEGDFWFEELTSPWLGAGLRVVKAFHANAVPLVFGIGHPWFEDLPECMRVQPIG
jgi:ribosomal protein S12 methylthiotransferase accessory factor YcaO